MSSIAENLEQMQSLTKTNLQILKTLNDSFFTKRDHLVVNVDDKQYVIPSFISLENKVNALQENLENLVHAPKTGEAYFNFDGNSQAIEVRGFTCTPNSLKLTPVEEYGVEANNIFKDFITPNAYVNIALSGEGCYIPNDISTVNVKKVIARSDRMKSIFESLLSNNTSVSTTYADILKIISIYTKDLDYVEYDTVRQLPIRKAIGSGTYYIKSIDSDVINPDLTEYITLTISNPLTYKLFDETIEKRLQAGDELVTFDDSAKVRIVEVRPNANQIVVEVLNGDYLNLVAETGDESIISDLSKLKFFSPVNFEEDKYIKVPLEEDQFVAIFVAPLNTRMNVQSPWGSGILFNTYELTNGGDTKYKEFYDENVKNIGDILFELTSIINNSVTKYSVDEFNSFTKYKPVIDDKVLSVVQINKHLNDSTVVKNIRSLYSQKKQYKVELEDIQKNIDNVNSQLSSISFDDTTNLRTVYESQLSEYNKKKSELVTSINSIISEISIAVSDSEVPIENAKYHIRGFFKWNTDESDKEQVPFKEHVHGIQVQYRYKNKNKETGNATTTLDSNIFSDWNIMNSFKRQLTPSIDKDTYYYKFEYSDDDSNLNVPSFNQIDIPISQGETVDIRLKVVYDFGYPFIETTSEWSDIVNIEFPSEFLKDVQVLDIIKENNSEIESNRFTNILRNEGIVSHVDDKLVDQDITYLHHPEYIASGFYTAERRVIPLKDKLTTMDTDIVTLKDIVLGSNAENIDISVIDDDNSFIIRSGQSNNITLTTPLSQKVVTLQLANKSSDRSINLYSIFPGNRSVNIIDSTRSKFSGKEYNVDVAYNTVVNSKVEVRKDHKQVHNQYIYFRSIDPWNGVSVFTTQNIFPYTYQSDKQLCTDNDEKFSYLTIRPGEAVQVPVYIDGAGKLMFDLRPSLYEDLVTYEIEFSYSNDLAAKLVSDAVKIKNNPKYIPVV